MINLSLMLKSNESIAMVEVFIGALSFALGIPSILGYAAATKAMQELYKADQAMIGFTLMAVGVGLLISSALPARWIKATFLSFAFVIWSTLLIGYMSIRQWGAVSEAVVVLIFLFMALYTLCRQKMTY